MDHTSTVPHTSILQKICNHTNIHKKINYHTPKPSTPFMNKMDEISYWIATKQAPCLFNYVNVIKRQCEEANGHKSLSVHSEEFQIGHNNKVKRKLSLLDDDDSVTTELQQNVYFDSSQNKNHQSTLDNSFESDSLGSKNNFNIRKSSTHKKPKKCSKSKTVHKKLKLATSTPKLNGNLRRSMRKTPKNNYSDLDNSFDMLTNKALDTKIRKNNNASKQEISCTKVSKARQKHADGDHRLFEQCYQSPQTKRENINDEPFDDMSDLSGFTANYIRSTKIDSTNKNKKLRGRVSQNFIRETGNNIRKTGNAIIMRVNKSANTSLSKTPLVNYSSGSTNIMNLVTLKTPNNTKPLSKVSRSTSLLKLIDSKHTIKKICNSPEMEPKKTVDVVCLQKTGSTRYPKRKNNASTEDINTNYETHQVAHKLNKRNRNNKSNNELDSELKNNPEILLSRTRSGKCLALTQRQAENSVLVINNSTDPISSKVSMNVATPNDSRVLKKSKKTSVKKNCESKHKHKMQSHRDSLRNSSGFAACFSDSEGENGIEKKKKYFC